MRTIVIAALALLLPWVAQAQYDDPDNFQHVYIVGVGKSEDYRGLKKRAQNLAKRIGMPYSDADRIHDTEKGLIYPKDYKEDEMYAGDYLLRRDIDNEQPAVTLEMRGLYAEDFERPREMTIIVGIYSKKEAAEAMYRKVKAVDADAYLTDRPKFFIGCLH